MSTLTDVAPATTAKHRSEVATSLPPARGQSFLKLVTIELRKSVNTRSGRVLIAAILLIALAALAWQITHLPKGPAGFDGFFHFTSSTMLGSAASISLRTRTSIAGRQSFVFFAVFIAFQIPFVMAITTQKTKTPERCFSPVSNCFAVGRLRVVVNPRKSERTQQNCANEHKHGAHRQHIESQGMIHDAPPC